jgi:hypothetical protein
MMRTNATKSAIAIVFVLAAFSQLPPAFAETTNLDAMTTKEFLSRCDSDKTRWCSGRIVNVQIAELLSQSLNNEPHSFCVPPQGSQETSEYMKAIQFAVTNWLKQRIDQVSATPSKAIAQALSALWPCRK